MSGKSILMIVVVIVGILLIGAGIFFLLFPITRETALLIQTTLI